MTHKFTAKIYQEHSGEVRNLALSLEVPKEHIVFKTENCPLGIIEICIEFENKNSLNDFLQKIQRIPCVLKS